MAVRICFQPGFCILSIILFGNYMYLNWFMTWKSYDCVFQGLQVYLTKTSRLHTLKIWEKTIVFIFSYNSWDVQNMGFFWLIKPIVYLTFCLKRDCYVSVLFGQAIRNIQNDHWPINVQNYRQPYDRTRVEKWYLNE